MMSRGGKENGARGGAVVCEATCARRDVQAALSHIAVSNALLISGMFVPKPAFALAFVLAFGAGFSMTGAASAARSHDPFS